MFNKKSCVCVCGGGGGLLLGGGGAFITEITVYRPKYTHEIS